MAIGSQEWSGLSLAGGRYRISAKLGEGGMGFVYRALDQNIDSEVVIKVPRQAMMDDPEFASRFTREIRSLVKLSHPHIVKVTDVGTYEGIPFAVMQYLAGGSLEDQRPATPDGQPLPCDPRNIPRWLIAVAQALDYIHTQGYVHRDVKPGNILFDSLGHAFLSDFGVAKVLASSTNAAPAQPAMTGAGMVLGTPEYMAPELIMGEPFDGRVDQYALAITVYELLCGRRPFEDETKTKVLVLHTSKTPAPLTAWCQTVPVRLSEAVLKGLAKDPRERYATCVELAKAVSAAAESTVAQDERIRLKCSSCGKTGSMPVADLARLKAGGGRATCPACKAPIDIGNAVHVAPGPTTGGTMKFSISGSDGSAGGHAPPEWPQPERGGAMALSASERQVPPPLPGKSSPPPRGGSGTLIERALPQGGSGTLIERALPRGGSGTLIERALPRSDDDAATAVFKSLKSSEPERLASPTQVKAAAGGPSPAAIPAWIWAAAAAGATTLLLVIAFVVSRSGTAEDAKSKVAQLVPKNSVAASAPQATAQPKPQSSGSALPKQSSPAPPAADATNLAKAAELAISPGVPSGTGKPASPNAPLSAHADDPKPDAEAAAGDAPPTALAKSVTPAESPKKGATAASMFADGQFNRGLLQLKPASPPVYLDKLLAAPRSHSGQTVMPAGMYNLAPLQAGGAAGPRKWIATERKIGSKKDSSELEMSLAPSSGLEVEPKLASRLDELQADQWKDRVSLLTLWVTNEGTCGLVKVEILSKGHSHDQESGIHP